MRSSWEDRKRSKAYYCCLLLVFGYAGIGLFLGVVTIGMSSKPIEAIVFAALYTAVVLILFFGLGVSYRHRGINPDTRNIMTTADPLYYDPTEIEERP